MAPYCSLCYTAFVVCVLCDKSVVGAILFLLENGMSVSSLWHHLGGITPVRIPWYLIVVYSMLHFNGDGISSSL